MALQIYRADGTPKTVAPGVVPVVTALPAVPSDGQEVLILADATQGVIWRFRYNAASSSPYKWEFVGGGSLYSAVPTDEQRGASQGDLTTIGPRVFLPLGGDYEYIASANAYAGNPTSSSYITVSSPPGTSAGEDFSNARHFDTFGITETLPGKLLNQPTGREVRLQYGCTVGVCNFRYRKLSVRPIRVG